jgi:predicted phosphodiesterase
MRLHVLSDLHFDVRRKSWSAFASRIPSDVGDVLVLAGDVLCMNDVAAREMLGSLRPKAKEVVYVLGNHEHFYGVFDETKAIAADICKDLGVHLLDVAATTVAGRRFIGGTLWFPLDQEALRYRHMMMDFQLIEKFEDAVYRDNEREVQLLRRQIRRDDIVVTHHLPAWSSVAAEYQTGPHAVLNPFFVCDCQEINERRQPALWIHGHTHVPCDYRIGETRVVCNPIGYPREGGGVEERLGLFVDV